MRASDEDLNRMMVLTQTIIDHKDEDDAQLSDVFMTVPTKREVPDYLRVIKMPMALKTVVNKIKQKKYAGYEDYITDVTRIFHNAKTYNRPSSGIYKDAVTLEELFLSELQKLAMEPNAPITKEQAVLADLGPLPPASPSDDGEDALEGSAEPAAKSSGDEDEDGEEDEDEEMPDADAANEEEEDDEDEDDDGDNQNRRRSRRSVKRKAETVDDDASDGQDKSAEASDARKKRGRPPRVDTPMECRIKAILKGVRKYKHEDGTNRHSEFEKLPDPKVYPKFYSTWEKPISIDVLKKRVKRREYKSVSEFMDDLNFMFQIALAENPDPNSQIHQDAVYLKAEGAKFAELELAKPDSEYMDEASKHFSKQPLSEIFHNGETFRIGDWVHIRNPNDAEKPIVGQIFRCWRSPDQKVWLNVCWYYRPEQMVHRVNKRFFEDEVAKTGQYRDHEIDEVIERCFVMFYTKASRGRPPNSEGKKIYVCESRYNEEQGRLNRIKTWKSCIPDEIRNQTDDTVMWEKPVPLKKFPSPLKDLLPADAKLGDPIPTATLGHKNAPPIRGAVYIGARGPNDSPSPEPTPPPRDPTPPPPPAPVVQTQTQPRPPRRASNMAPVNSFVPPPQMPAYQATPQQIPPYMTPQQHYYPQPAQPQVYHPPPQNPAMTGYQNSNDYANQQYAAGYGQFPAQTQNQATETDAMDMPGEGEAITIPDFKPAPEIEEYFVTNDKGQIVWHKNPPRLRELPKLTFAGVHPNSTGTMPIAAPIERHIHTASTSLLKSMQYMKLNKLQQKVLADAKVNYENFMANERKHGFTAMENRPYFTAMVKPVEDAWRPIFQELGLEHPDLVAARKSFTNAELRSHAAWLAQEPNFYTVDWSYYEPEYAKQSIKDLWEQQVRPIYEQSPAMFPSWNQQ